MHSNKRVIFTTVQGNVCVIIPAEGTDLNEEVAKLTQRGDIAPADIPELVDVTEIPSDRTLRDAWKRGEQGKKCGIDMTKGKEIAHVKRRAKRAQEFAPLDVEATIPAKANEAEAARQAIRDKYATIQTNIDACATPEQLVSLIKTNGL